MNSVTSVASEAIAASERETLFVLIPCLNEQDNVSRAVAEVLQVAGALPVETSVVLIDDGSTDATRSVMESIAAREMRCSVVVNERNLGLGRSVLKCVATLPANAWITVYPGDNEFLFSSVTNFLEVRGRYDLVLGYLHNPVVRTFGRRVASHLFTKLVCTFYGFPWRYLNGMKLYRANVFQGLEVTSSGHAFMAEAIAKAQLRRPDLRIGEVAFYSRGRGAGRSKAIRVRSVLREVLQVMKGARAVSRYRRFVLGESARLS